MFTATSVDLVRRVLRAERGLGLGVLRNIAGNVRQLLEDRELSQKQLADMVGVDESLVSRWFKGTRTIDLEHVDRLAEVLGVSYEFLVRDPEENRQTKVKNRDLDALIEELARLRGKRVIKG